MPTRLTWTALLLTAWLALAAPPGVRAHESVRVTVVLVLATSKNNAVDPELKGLAQEVQKIKPQLTGFRLARTTAKSLPVGKSHEFPLVEKETLTVTVEHGADEDDRVGVKVKPPRMREISYTSACGKFLPIITRCETKDKECVIIAVMVEPCHK